MIPSPVFLVIFKSGILFSKKSRMRTIDVNTFVFTKQVVE
jgi:hypothetical protein